MKILFISPQPFFRIRGTPINVRNVVTVLAEAGHHVDLLCYPWGEDIDIPGVQIIRSPRIPGIRDVKIGPSLAKFPLDALMFFKALGMCSKKRYDLIHAVEEAAFFSVWLKKLFKCRLVYDVDSGMSDQLRDSRIFFLRSLASIEEWFEKITIRNSTFVLTVCESLTDRVKELVPDARVVQIEDAPLQSSFQSDKDGAAALREEYALGTRPVVVYTGNLEKYQGVELLLRAVSIVRRQRDDVRCVIVGGEPPQIARLKKIADSLDMSSACIFAGKRPVDEMAKFMTMADVLVSPRTKGVNTALKIYTYMQSGKPIVATRLPTHTQVLDEKCAILVLPQADDLAAGILRALKEPLLASALGKDAQARVASRYSLASFKHKVRTAYREMLGD